MGYSCHLHMHTYTTQRVYGRPGRPFNLGCQQTHCEMSPGMATVPVGPSPNLCALLGC